MPFGLFQGMFEGNILTFNPGWDENAQNLENFDDVRDIQKHLKSNKVKLSSEADENTTGPASLTLSDPDGNVILIDQHRPSLRSKSSKSHKVNSYIYFFCVL